MKCIRWTGWVRTMLAMGLFVALSRMVCAADDLVVMELKGSPIGEITLKQAAQGQFNMGVGINDRIAERPEDWKLVTSQFHYLTPENCMKMPQIAPAEGKFNFALPDAFVGFGVEHQFKICGHCLVWAKDDRTPDWFYRTNGNLLTREQLLARMRSYIQTVAGRYRGRLTSWDVVNEALDDGTNFLRPSQWLTICGPEFIVKAFEYAHEADPGAVLIYNDYNNELPFKREKMVRLVQYLKDNKAPLNAIGLQGHYEIDQVPFRDIEDTIVAMKKMGMKLVVSELDIDVIPRSRWWADGGKYHDEMSKIDPYREGCPPELLKRQAEQYAELFRIFHRHKEAIERISFWNLHDGQSWLNDFPWKRVNHPLLFDRQGKPKPAFDAVIKVMSE